MSHKVLLCVNFEQTKALNKRVGRYKLSLLFGRIHFQCSKTKLPNGEIARTIEQIADGSHRGLTATTEDLRALEAFGLIKTRVGMWKGEKRTFISCAEDWRLRLDAKKLSLMNKYTGGDMASLTLSLAAYFLDVNPLHYRDGDWVMVAREQVQELFNVSARTANAIVRGLEEKGIIKLHPCRYWGKGQYRIKISGEFCKKIAAELEELREIERKEKIARQLSKQEKSDVSIRLTTDTRVDIINNNTLADENGNVILSKKQENYIVGAVKRTITKSPGLDWSVEMLIAQVKYAVSNMQQRRGTQSFAHAINRAMFLIRKGLWLQPFGFEKYSAEGRRERERLKRLEEAHRCEESKRRIAENEQRVKHLGERSMYEKDEDYGNVGVQFKMAKEIMKDTPLIKPRVAENSHSPIRNPIIKPLIHTRIDEGAKQFEGHEDVMAKLLWEK